MSNSIITVYFLGGSRRYLVQSSLYQYDYGQTLKIEGLELPAAYEVHFSNSEEGTSITMIGTTDGVDIPDSLLQSGDPIFAYIFLHDGEDDGETVRKIKIPVKARPAYDTEVPTEEEKTAIAQALEAFNAAVEALHNMGVTAVTLEPGSDATAAWDADNALMTFGIPKGEKGDTGFSLEVVKLI